MRTHTHLASWQTHRTGADYQARSVGFVPTMGALHAGHRSLLERARAENDRVVLSIFVNPTQFNDPADLERYPRNLEQDLELARGLADDVIIPSAVELYPDGYDYRLVETRHSRELEGEHRPGHFEGMLTVVLKLFNLVRPHRAYFGEKDWQQLQLISGLVAALFLPIRVVGCPTRRDADGLALSSRNLRLPPELRRQATIFPVTLRSAPDAATAALQLHAAGFKVDYVEDRDGVRLAAVHLAGVRLIDNVRL